VGNSETLVAEHIDYAKALARKVSVEINSAIDIEELEAYGMQGLVEAASRFDPSKGAKFKTFSYYRIRGAIFDGLRKTGWLGRNEYARYQAASDAYLENTCARNLSSPKLDETSSDQDIVERIQETIEDLSVIFVTSLEGYTASTGLEVADDVLSVEDSVISKDHRTKLVAALVGMPADEVQLIEQHYFQGFSFVDISKQMNISKSWCSRLHVKAIRNLGNAYRDLYDNE